MRIPDQYNPYLKGDEYMNVFRVKFIYEKEDWQYVSRMDILRELSENKKVVHFGCVDHNVSVIERKIKSNKWLHKILCDSAERCYGVDINEEGIRYLRDNLGYKDVEAVDILCSESVVINKDKWDYLFIPEVLEHVNNPVEFLEKIRGKFSSNVDKVVITVPNAFSTGNFRNARRGFERINSDHRYWFTPYTMCRIAVESGFCIGKIIMCRRGRIRKGRILQNYYLKRHPLMRDNILIILGFN